MSNFTITDSQDRTVDISSYDDMTFIIKHEDMKIGEFNLDSTDEDGVHIQFMNINKPFQGSGIGTQLLIKLVDVYGADIHQPFEKYKFHNNDMEYPRLDSESEKFINKAIKLKILNEYQDFHEENFYDEYDE